MKSSVIVWARDSRRSELLAQHMGASLHYVFHGQRNKLLHAPGRYLTQAKQTWDILIKERPDVVFVQNPPIFCPLIAALYAKRYGARYVIDSHTAAFHSPKWRWSLGLHRMLSKGAAATIVSNSQLQSVVQSWGIEAIVLGYTPGNYPVGDQVELGKGFNAVVVCSYHEDEPVDVIFAAAERLPRVNFYITGNDRHLDPELRAKKPANCHLTGFISYDRYVGLMRNADLVIDLTTRDHTLLMGAFEAVSLGTPMVLSDWPVLREYFSKGAIHVDNSIAGLTQGIERAMQEHERLRREIHVLQRELNEDWDRKFNHFQRLIYQS